MPPSIAPPSRFHEPVRALKARVAPALFTVPVRLTVVSDGVNEPRPAGVKLPPRSTVLFVAVIVPALDQASPCGMPPRTSVDQFAVTWLLLASVANAPPTPTVAPPVTLRLPSIVEADAIESEPSESVQAGAADECQAADGIDRTSVVLNG